MIRSLSLSVVLLVCSDVSSDAQEKKIDQGLTDKVMSGIADLTLLRDDVQERFAMFVVGETHRVLDKKPPTITERFMFRAADRPRRFTYIANGHMLQRREDDPLAYRQYWTELVIAGHDVKARDGTTASAYTLKPKGMDTQDFIDRELTRLDYLEPFDDLVLHPMFSLNPGPNENWTEKVYLKESKLVSVEAGAQGHLISKWRWDFRIFHYDIELTQAEPLGYMPVEVKYRGRMPNMPNSFGHTRIEWKKAAKFDRYLPYRVEAAYGDPDAGSVTENFFRFHWRIGKEIGDELFDFTSLDNRVALSKYFGDFQFDVWDGRLGLLPGTSFESVSDIFIEAEAEAR